MSKEDMIKEIEKIDKQLKENKETINKYGGELDPHGTGIMVLCELSQMLLSTREMLQDMLLKNYGFYYMRGSN